MAPRPEEVEERRDLITWLVSPTAALVVAVADEVAVAVPVEFVIASACIFPRCPRPIFSGHSLRRSLVIRAVARRERKNAQNSIHQLSPCNRMAPNGDPGGYGEKRLGGEDLKPVGCIRRREKD